MTTRTVLTATLALALTPSAAYAAPWSAPRSVTVSGQAREPVVALGGPDTAAVAYVRRINGADRVELRQGTVASLRSPVILARDARHGFDSPTLIYSGHSALVIWRQFRDPDTRVLELASVTPSGATSGPRAITGPPNSYNPVFTTPNLVTFWRRTAAYSRTILQGRPGVTTRLPAGAAFESRVARLADGSLVAVWPSGGAIYAARLAPGMTAYGPTMRLSGPGGFARSPQLAVTPDGHAIAVWTQSSGVGRALMSAAAPSGGAFGPAIELAPPSAQALTAAAIGTSAGDVLVTFVSARSDNPAGPLRALRLAPDGHAVTPLLALTPPGERTRDAALAIDNSAGYAAWVTAGTGRRVVRVVRIAAGAIVGTVRTVSGSDNAASAPPALAMTRSGRAMIAYATRGNQIRLVTRRSG